MIQSEIYWVRLVFLTLQIWSPRAPFGQLRIESIFHGTYKIRSRVLWSALNSWFPHLWTLLPSLNNKHSYLIPCNPSENPINLRLLFHWEEQKHRSYSPSLAGPLLTRAEFQSFALTTLDSFASSFLVGPQNGVYIFHGNHKLIIPASRVDCHGGSFFSLVFWEHQGLDQVWGFQGITHRIIPY